MKQINGKHVTKVINWCFNFLRDCQTIMQPNQVSDGLYECVIDIPKVDKTVIGIGACEIDAIDNATTKASALIDEYMKNHPSTQITNYFENMNYILEENNEGFVSIRINKS